MKPLTLNLPTTPSSSATTERAAALTEAQQSHVPFRVAAFDSGSKMVPGWVRLEPVPGLYKAAALAPSLETLGKRVDDALCRIEEALDNGRADTTKRDRYLTSLRDLVRNFVMAVDAVLDQRAGVEEGFLLRGNTLASAERLHKALMLSEPLALADLMARAVDALKGWSAQAERARASAEAASAANAEVERLREVVRRYEGGEGSCYQRELTALPPIKFVRFTADKCRSPYGNFKKGEVYRVSGDCATYGDGGGNLGCLDLCDPAYMGAEPEGHAIGTAYPGEYEVLPDVPTEVVPGAVVRYGDPSPESGLHRLVLRVEGPGPYAYARVADMQDVQTLVVPFQKNGSSVSEYTPVRWHTGANVGDIYDGLHGEDD